MSVVPVRSVLPAADVSRRTFLRAGLAGGATFLGAGTDVAARPPDSPQPGERPARHDAPPFDLEELSIADLQSRMVAGEDTARSLVERYTARIEALDREGPQLRQVLELNPEALSLADTLDAERKAGKLRGPLHGVPILLKDNIGTADRMTTTAGSLALEGCIVARDAFVAARLRDAGAILLGMGTL